MAAASSISAAAPPPPFRSSSEHTALSIHNYTRLRQTNHPTMQQPASSVSPPIITSPTSALDICAMNSHIASRQYVDQHRAFVEHQRQLHEEERQLWHLEREELHQRITSLEHLVQQLGGQLGSPIESPPAVSTDSHDTLRGRSTTTNTFADRLSRVATVPSAGDEFWRGTGGKVNAPSTRAFSEPPGRGASAIANTHHLPSISEAPDSTPQKKSVGFELPHTNAISRDFYIHPIPKIAANQTEGTLDGITFKPSVIISNGTGKGHSSSQNASPVISSLAISQPSELAPSSESREPKPQLLDLPESGLTASDLRVKDAGHTPLARMINSVSTVSATDTPTKVSAEAAIAEEVTHPARPPTERSNSYFPVTDEAAQLPPLDSLPEDPALSGPLALSNRPGDKDDAFLNQLQSKLLKAQSQETIDIRAEALSTLQTLSDHPEPSNQSQPRENEDQEPRLKIKRSMNFGSVFGAATVGRDM